MDRRWGDDADAVKARYSLDRFDGSVSASYVEADADERVVCPSRRLARMASAANKSVFAYSFEHLQISCDGGFALQTLPWWVPPDQLRTMPAYKTWATHGCAVAVAP